MAKSQRVLCLALVYLIANACPSSGDPAGKRCAAVAGTPSCVCEADDGIIDLREISSSSGTPRFTGMQDINSFLYDYNPCSAFTTVGGCENVHVCQASGSDPTETYDIADAGTEQMWIGDDNIPYVYYTGPNFRETFVYLQCDPTLTGEPQISTTGDSNQFLVYDITIRSCHACAGNTPGCSSNGGGGGGVSAGIGGIILVLLLGAGIVGYFVIGAVIMKVHFHKEGTDIIPQKFFWFALPGLIKEGFLFTCCPIYIFVRGLIKKDEGYKQEL